MNVGSILSEGFRVIRERPWALMVWALLYLVATVGMALLIRPMTMFQRIGSDPTAFMPLLRQFLLMEFVVLALMVVLFTAAQRAVLFPERSNFAYMRLGMDELRMLALSIILFVGLYAVMIVLMIVMVAAFAAVGALLGPILAVPLMIIGMIAAFAGSIWISVRLALAFPLTLLRRKLIIGDAWRLSKGHFWTMFGAALVVMVISFVILSVAAGLNPAFGWTQLLMSRADPQQMEALQAQMVNQASKISVMMVVSWIFSAAGGTLSLALWGGGLAAAARAVTPQEDLLAETFA